MSAVTVRAAPLLHRYTRGAAVIRGRGETLAELLDDLDHRFPGIRFRLIDEQDRMRPHVRFFVNRTHTRVVGQFEFRPAAAVADNALSTNATNTIIGA